MAPRAGLLLGACLAALALLCLSGAKAAEFVPSTSAESPSTCPSACPSLKASSAASLAVSLVAFVGCSGDIEGAARAMVAAASSGDTEAFTAGLSIGAATVTGQDNKQGQMAEALSQTFTIANADSKAKAVASAVGGAINSMPATSQLAMIAEAIGAANDVADGGQCGLASEIAFEMYRSIKTSNPVLAAKFLAQTVLKGRVCWTRRLAKLATSPIFNKPAPVSPCTSYMRDASATSVSMLTASSCGLPTTKQIDAAAYALVTAAVKGGCSFASAVASVSLSGVTDPKKIIAVYQSAIPQARKAGASGALANAFTSSLYEVVGVKGDASGLLSDILTAISGTIATSGCAAASEFTTGVYSRLVAQDPTNEASLKKDFLAAPGIAKCQYSF